MKPQFVHLHAHSDASLGDATTQVEDMARRAAELGMPALALTDHGTMANAVAFYNACRKYGIKPIVGIEAYVAWRDAREPKSPENPTGHMILLARDYEGYQNLCRLLSWSNEHGMSYKPRIDLNVLAAHADGLLGLASCVDGLPQICVLGKRTWDASAREHRVLEPRPEMLDEMIGSLQDILGKENYYLEIQNHCLGMPQGLAPGQQESYRWLVSAQRAVAQAFIEASRRLDVPVVGTNDLHYLTPDMADSRDAVNAIDKNLYYDSGFSSSDEYGGHRFEGRRTVEDVAHETTGQMFLKSPEEMFLALKGQHFPELLTNTLAVAERCNLVFEAPTDEEGRKIFHLPEVRLPEDKTLEEHFRDVVLEGYAERYPDDPPEARERLEYELEVMHRLRYERYHLVMKEILDWSRENGIRLGPGRGSAAGSLVVYCLGITELCPLRHGLIFERFLNPSRVSSPDIDVDFDPARTADVIAHCQERYGKDRVAKIAAYHTLGTRAVLKDLGRCFGMSDDAMEWLVAELPKTGEKLHYSVRDLLDDPSSRPAKTVAEFLRKGGETAERMLDLCARLEGTRIHRTKHAAGLVIADRPLRGLIPLAAYDADKPDEFTTEIPHQDLESQGLLKLDILSIEGLTIIDRCVRFIRERHDPDFDLPPDRKQAYDDPETYAVLSRGETVGVWQLSSPGMQRLCMKVGPSTIDEISAILALYRPGPLDSTDPVTGLTMVETFIKRKRGQVEVVYDHPCLEPVLRNTFGILVFQEQVMQMTQVLCGWTLTEADNMRKAIGKKDAALMASFQEKFLQGAIETQGCDPQLAAAIWDKVEKFARYSFNKAHSSAYGVLAYQMAWLKAHYRVEFLAACLSRVQAKNTKEQKAGYTHLYVEEALRHSIPVLGPDILRSRAEAAPEERSIRLGFNAVKGIGATQAEKIAQVELRSDMNLAEIVLTLGQNGVGPALMKRLAQCGGFQDYGPQTAVIDLIDTYAKSKTSKKRQAAFFGLTEELELGEGTDPEPDELESTLQSMVQLVPLREALPPPRICSMRVDEIGPDSPLLQLPQGPTDLYLWIPLDSTRSGLVEIRGRALPARPPSGAKILQVI